MVTILLFHLATSNPANGKEINDPIGSMSNKAPNAVSDNENFSCIVGILAAQLEKMRP